MADEPEQEIYVADPNGFQAVAIKLFAETYYLCKLMGKEAHQRLVEDAMIEYLADGETDKVAIAEWWNERLSTPMFQFRDKEPPPKLIIMPGDK